MDFQSAGFRFNSRFIFAACVAGILLISGLAQATDLINDDGFTYDITDSTGELSDGSHSGGLDDACDGCWGLEIDGSGFNGGLNTTDLDGRELVHNVLVQSGLNVHRRTYVPQSQNFVRYLNILENPTGADIIVTVGMDTNLGSDSSTTVIASSSGDTTVDETDSWASTNGDAADPRMAHVWDGPGGADSVDAITNVPGTGNGNIDWEWQNVTVPANSTVIYMALGSMQLDNPAATNSAQRLFGMGYAAIFDGLDAATIDQIQNWDLGDDNANGIPDGWETFYGVSDAAADPDADGLTNLEEFQSATNPNEADTDNDGLNDGDEVNTHNTNPNNTDTDGDGISDGGEVNAGLDPLDASDGLPGPLATNVDRPSTAIDSNGNLHLAYMTQSNDDAMYMMFDADGQVLIDATDIDPLDDCEAAPVIALTSDDQVLHICYSDYEIFFFRINPAADDQSGDAADPAVIVEASTQLNNNGRHSQTIVDASDNLHVVNGSCGDISYESIDPDGNVVTAQVSVSTCSSSHALPDIALDSNGNAHLAWTSDDSTTDNELYYAMVDTSDGSTMIAPTMLTIDDGERAMHSTILVNGTDQVAIVFGEDDGMDFYADNDIFMMKLDPTANAQDGSPLDPANITMARTRISAQNGVMSWYVRAFATAGGDIDVIWSDNPANDVDSTGPGCDINGSYHVMHTRVAWDASPVIAEQELTDMGGCMTYTNYYSIAGGMAYVTNGAGGLTGFPLIGTGDLGVDTATGSGTATITSDAGLIVSIEALAPGQRAGQYRF